MGAAISQGALIAIVCNGLVGFLLLLLWVILCWACHSRLPTLTLSLNPVPTPALAPVLRRPHHPRSPAMKAATCCSPEGPWPSLEPRT
nr:GAAI470 [Homo sapiens]